MCVMSLCMVRLRVIYVCVCDVSACDALRVLEAVENRPDGNFCKPNILRLNTHVFDNKIRHLRKFPSGLVDGLQARFLNYIMHRSFELTFKNTPNMQRLGGKAVEICTFYEYHFKMNGAPTDFRN